MEFFTSAVDALQTLVVALGAALCVWGGVNLLEGYGSDNRAQMDRVHKKASTQNDIDEIDRQQIGMYI